ncbi:MAG: hypothetical protein AAFN76_12005 [Pseudomonadota bacterium]
MFASLRPLHVEENAPDRLQLQYFDTTMGFVFLVMCGVAAMAGIANLSKGEILNGIVAILLAKFLLAIPILFLGVKRITIDPGHNTLWLTNRALLRYSLEEYRLNDITDLVLVDRTTGTSGPRDLAPEEEFVAVRNAYYTIEARFHDRDPVVLFSRSGQSVYNAGQVIMIWWRNFKSLNESP